MYQPLRNRVETFLFPATGRASWEQIKDGAASRGHMLWVEPTTLDRMREALIFAGEWREEAGQILKPPFDETTSVHIEYSRDKETGEITTTDIRLLHADQLLVRLDGEAWCEHDQNSPLVTPAMLIEFRAVDTKGVNKEGSSYRIENTIELFHEFMESPTSGNKVVKVKVVPPSCTLLYTIDDTNPANNGKPYETRGIDAQGGVPVRLHAQKGNVTKDERFVIPKHIHGSGPDGPPSIKPDMPLIVKGQAFKHLVNRSLTYQFLSSLPEAAGLQTVQVKVTHAATDTSVTLQWDSKTRLDAQRIISAFAFLDHELADGEWLLRFGQLHFASGKSFLEWQVASNTKIELGNVSQ